MKMTHSNYASPHFAAYTSFGADIDLEAASLAPTAADKSPCRQIICVSGGVLVLQRKSDGANITTPTLAAGQVLNVQASKIIASGTTATSVIVCW